MACKAREKLKSIANLLSGAHAIYKNVVGTPENSKEGTQARVHRNPQLNLEMNVLFSSGTALLDLSLSKAPFSQKPGPKQDLLTICLVFRMTSSSL